MAGACRPPASPVAAFGCPVPRDRMSMIQLSDPEIRPSAVGSLLKSWGPAALCVLIGFLSAFTIPLVGQIPVGELILFAILPWVLVRTYAQRGWPTRIQQLGWYRLLLVLVGFMAVGYVISDLYRATSGDNLARGWARVAFLAVDLVTIVYLINGSWRRLHVFIFALYVGNTVNALLAGPLFERWWEFGIGYTLSAIAIFACAGLPVLIQSGVAGVFGAASLVLGARSLGGICLMTAVLFGMRSARGFIRPLAYLCAAGAMAALVFAANTVVVQNEDKSASNVERQSMIEAAGEAFIGSPLIGQGSWFTASRLLARLEERRENLDPTFHGYSPEEARQLSIHSQLLVALAEGGILGGSFFLVYGALLLKTLRTLMRNSMPHRAFVFYLVIDGLWNLCMSPFSGVARVAIALAVGVCLLVILQRQGELSEDYRE
jgi:hypothetical protein